jgi:hypothetical protein
MKLYYSFLIFTFVLINIQKMIAQSNPINDPSSWNLQPSGTSGGSEEFNSALDFTNKWHDQYRWGDYANGAEIEKPANLTIETAGGYTYLKIKADTLVPSVTRTNDPFCANTPPDLTIVYQGGLIQSKMLGGVEVYKFGYLEIEAIYPTSVYPLWPAFWLWSASCPTNPAYDEIDICENGADDAFAGHNMGTNVHLYSSCSATTNSGQSITGLPLLSTTWHKYAVEWGPDRIIWYFDDTPVRTIYDPTGSTVPQNAMAVFLNLSISQYFAYLPSDWNEPTFFGGPPPVHGDNDPTSFPQYFKINYLHYYKLNTACSNDLTICTPSTDYASRAVERSITTGGSCSPTFNPTTTSSSYTLRATDYITLDAGTTIDPTSSGYIAAETLACPQ